MRCSNARGELQRRDTEPSTRCVTLKLGKTGVSWIAHGLIATIGFVLACGPPRVSEVVDLRLDVPLDTPLRYEVIVDEDFVTSGNTARRMTTANAEVRWKHELGDTLVVEACFSDLTAGGVGLLSLLFPSWPSPRESACLLGMTTHEGVFLGLVERHPLELFAHIVIPSLLPLLPPKPIQVGSTFKLPYSIKFLDSRGNPTSFDGEADCALEKIDGYEGEEVAHFYCKYASDVNEDADGKEEWTTEIENSVSRDHGYVIEGTRYISIKGSTDRGDQYGVAVSVQARLIKSE